MKGTLSEGVVPGLLRELYVGRRSGHLHFTRGQERRSVRFHKGSIVHGDTNVDEDRLGEMLVRQGLIGAADLERATDLVKRGKVRLGEAFIDLGILDKPRLSQALTAHAREVLLKVFSWNEGDYRFEDEGPGTPTEEDVSVMHSTGEIILDAVRVVKDPDVVRYALGDIDRVLGLSTDPLLRFQKITLTPADGFILSRVDGTLSAREVIQLAPFGTEEAQRSIFGLLCTGIVEYLPVPPKPRREPRPVARSAPAPRPERPAQSAPTPAAPVPGAAEASSPHPAPEHASDNGQSETRRQEVLEAFEALKRRNHFEVLGINPGANDAQVKEAYFRLARRFHPDSHHDPALADLRDKFEAVFIRLGEAYEILRVARTRASYEAELAARAPRGPRLAPEPASKAASVAPPETDPSVEARLAFESMRKAEKYLEEEKYWDAIQLFEKVIPAAEGKVRQRAQVGLARAYVKNPKWVKRAEEVLHTVVQEDPKNADAYFGLGEIYRNGGLKSRALSMYRKVVELKPDHEEALVQVASLAPQNPEPPAEGGGLLKKLFGK